MTYIGVFFHERTHIPVPCGRAVPAVSLTSEGGWRLQSGGSGQTGVAPVAGRAAAQGSLCMREDEGVSFHTEYII